MRKKRPDLVRYPHNWVKEEMSQSNNPHTHWLEEMRASGKLNIGTHAVHEGYDNYSAQHYALWQVAAFRLPLAQQEASGWWDAPPTQQGLHSQDFLPPASGPLECPDHPKRKDAGCSQGTADLCRSIWNQSRSPMWGCQGVPIMHGPFEDHQQG